MKNITWKNPETFISLVLSVLSCFVCTHMHTFTYKNTINTECSEEAQRDALLYFKWVKNRHNLDLPELWWNTSMCFNICTLLFRISFV